jgi:predicted transport protein
MDKGFKTSPLKLNAGLGQLDGWNEETIRSRADRLADLAVKLWAEPRLPEETLAAYRQKPDATGYSIADHPFLLTRPDQELFDALSQEVLFLDPGVTREFLKYHVAFKAETNFVDVVPQARQLVLTLNMPFAEINDPKGLCKDISGVGHQGNGDVRFELSRPDQLPYAMGLVRQSFDRQMGDGGEG